MIINYSLKATTTLFHTYCAKAILNDKRNATSKFKVTEYRYMIHFYCLTEEAGFYSDVEESLPLDPATWVRFPAGFRSKT